MLVYIDNTELRKMIGCIGDDIATRNIENGEMIVAVNVIYAIA